MQWVRQSPRGRSFFMETFSTDWLAKLVPLSKPMRTKNKTSRHDDLLACILNSRAWRRLRAAWICSVFWLVHCAGCDWSENLLSFWSVLVLEHWIDKRAQEHFQKQNSKLNLNCPMPQAVHANSSSIVRVKNKDDRFFDHLNHFLQDKKKCFYGCILGFFYSFFTGQYDSAN